MVITEVIDLILKIIDRTTLKEKEKFDQYIKNVFEKTEKILKN